MKRAISVPNFGAYGDIREVAGLARRAEEAGFDGFFTWDHIVNTGWMPGGPPAPLPASDPTVALTAIALATERIHFGPMVTPLPRRRPWKLARETVSLDHLSGGRLILGVGLGFPADDEYERLGEPGGLMERARLLDEGLDVLTALWSGEPVSYQGRALQVDEVQMLPQPLQQPRIPIWCAGGWPGDAPFRRAARWDGVFPISADGGFLDPGGIAEVVAAIRSHLGSMDGYDVAAAVDVGVGRESAEERAFAEAGATWCVWSPWRREELEGLLA